MNAVFPQLDALLAGADRLTPLPGVPWADAIRKNGCERARTHGLPSRKEESWRFTNVQALNDALRPIDPDVQSTPDAAVLSAARFEGERVWEAVFWDGRFAPELSRLDGFPRTGYLGSLRGALEEAPECARAYLEQDGTFFQANPFVAINDAYLDAGALAWLPDGMTLDRPIHLMFLSSGSYAPPMRIGVGLGHGARAVVLESWVGPQGVPYFRNARTSIALGAPARLEYARIQREGNEAHHVAALDARLAAGSQWSAWSFSLGGRMARVDVHASLDGPGTEITIEGLYACAADHYADHHTWIEHTSPEGKSLQKFRGLLFDRARGVFSGRIVVHPGAQKTNAYQHNACLLLSPAASVNTNPQLEIHADDVRCTHGAAVGEIDPEALFYLQARSVPLDEARRILVRAFASDVLESSVLDGLRKSLDRTVDAFLHDPVDEHPGSGRCRLMVPFDVQQLRKEFPILEQRVHGKPLVYLDNAATTQKPKAVLSAIAHYFETANANVHRGVHALSARATEAYEGAREKVRAFLNAADAREIIFVRGATEGVNLVAESFVRPRLKHGDEILITHLEHHSNIVPWQMLEKSTGAVLRVVPLTDDGELEPGAFERMLGPRVKFAAVAHVSNALGTILPVERLAAAAHAAGVPILVDGAQAVPHCAVDVRAIGCDFYVFSSHKVYGPTGIGALYGRLPLLMDMRPYQCGGDMIRSVSFSGTTFAEPPMRFEAGTPHIAGAVGMGAAVDYVRHVGLSAIEAHEHMLLAHTIERLMEVPGIRFIGTARERAAVCSFVIDGIHPHDIGTILDREGVAIRTGHHCAQPVMERYGVPATARASFALYNTLEEVDTLAGSLRRVREVFR